MEILLFLLIPAWVEFVNKEKYTRKPILLDPRSFKITVSCK